ncbi:MAG: MFS transporter [Planctomycetes bacterium]|nr:MFS transporter [Planctomycetota bacterium]
MLTAAAVLLGSVRNFLTALWMKPDSRFRGALRAFENRNYRLFFCGHGLSLIGSWMQWTAMSWLVFKLTGQEFYLGLVGFMGGIMPFLLSPIAGTLADRVNRRKLLMATQLAAMILAACLSALTFTGLLQIWHIILLSFIGGLVNAFDMPIRQSFISQLVGRREDLPNVIAMNSFLVNSSRLIGPPIAGAIIAITDRQNPAANLGEAVCLTINAVSFLSILLALMAMRLPAGPQKAVQPNILRHLADGFRYAVGFGPIRTTLLMLAVVSLMGMSYATLIPAFVKKDLLGDAQTQGWLMGSVGVGAIGGSVILACLRDVRRLGRMFGTAPMIMGLALIGLSLAHSILLAMALMFFVGFGLMLTISGSNSLVQTLVDDDKRGRVMGFHAVAFLGVSPFGSLLAGSLAEKVGTPGVLLLGGCCCVLASAVYLTRLREFQRLAHPAYVRLGLIPESAPPPGLEEIPELVRLDNNGDAPDNGQNGPRDEDKPPMNIPEDDGRTIKP